MSRNVKTIGYDATVAKARALMRSAAVHHLVVLDGGLVVGVLSDRDLGGRVGARQGGAENTPVTEVMTTDVVSVEPDTTVRQAANRLRGRGVGSLVVMTGGRLDGIVTTTDLLELIGRGVERPIERAKRWTLRARGRRGGTAEARHERRS
jgi:acetoin utilization protein AcuB